MAETSFKIKVILVCAGLVAGFIITEGLARLLGLGLVPPPRRVVYRGTSREWCCGPAVFSGGIHRYEANSTFQHCYGGPRRDYFDSQGCVTYHINRWGYRTADSTLEKPAGVYRIIFLGDSFTFGEGTPDSMIYTTRVGLALDGHHIDGRRIEVINLGIPGEDGASELATYGKFGRELAADWVIVQWNSNDVPLSGVQLDHARLMHRQYRKLVDANPCKWSRLFSMLYFNLRLHQISNELITVTKEQAEKGPGIYDSIGLLRSVVQADGADFTVLAFPEIIRFNNYPFATLVDLLREYCRNQQIALIDLLPALSKHRDRELWVHEMDHHPNSIAHAIAATEVLKVITPKLDQDEVPKKQSQ